MQPPCSHQEHGVQGTQAHLWRSSSVLAGWLTCCPTSPQRSMAAFNSQPLHTPHSITHITHHTLTCVHVSTVLTGSSSWPSRSSGFRKSLSYTCRVFVCLYVGWVVDNRRSNNIQLGVAHCATVAGVRLPYTCLSHPLLSDQTLTCSELRMYLPPNQPTTQPPNHPTHQPTRWEVGCLKQPNNQHNQPTNQPPNPNQPHTCTVSTSGSCTLKNSWCEL